MSSVKYSPSLHQATTPVINIQSALCTSPDSVKNISLALSFGSNSNSYTVSVQSLYIYICMFFTIQKRWLSKNGKK